MNTPCANHPEKAGENLCDSCDRYLCAECLGAPVNRPGMLYYFCNREDCRRAYVAKLKKEGLAHAGLGLMSLMLIIASVWTNLTAAVFVLLCGLTTFASGIKLWREFRERQTKWSLS